MALRMANPIPRDIRSNMMLLKNSVKENPLVFWGLERFFHGAKRVEASFLTEKKYGKNIKIFTVASKK